MKNQKTKLLSLAIASVFASGASVALAGGHGEHKSEDMTLTDAIKGGKAYGDIRVRYETVEQDNALEDADALTVRTKLGYNTASYEGFSATVEFEDSRKLQGDFNSTQNGKGTYSVIADPETTELDQAFIQYKNDLVTAKLGAQVITLDGHRYVGHVGWRQDRQTFDALSVKYTPLEDLTITAAYIKERNRIFAEAGDIESKDTLLNVSYKTGLGKLTAYGYLLEVDNDTDNALDTYGLSFTGKTKASDDLSVLYAAEFAYQESESGTTERDAAYLFLEGGVSVAGITAKLGYESLGSDNGAYGFSTPLATLHKFNGWTDQFLATPGVGLVDTYLTLSTKVLGAKVALTYHDFTADEESASGNDDLGSELDIVVAKKFGKNYYAGLKYGAYSAGDSEFGKVDTDKMWAWAGLKF